MDEIGGMMPSSPKLLVVVVAVAPDMVNCELPIHTTSVGWGEMVGIDGGDNDGVIIPSRPGDSIVKVDRRWSQLRRS
jgi:hypothetical protein